MCTNNVMLTVAMIGCVFGAMTSSPLAMAQSPGGTADGPLKVSTAEKEDLVSAPAKVDVKPVARDEEIRKRLQSVLDVTGWFTDPQVEVREGVVFLSMQRPFETGDLVEVTGVTGYVQQLNVRTTILMSLDGNLVQIPNASVYKNNIRNFTTNANRREDFVVGIGYDDSINEAQEIARKVLADHPALLNDPEPSVLVDSLGKSTINLRVYFWLNGREHSWLKVRSSVIRLVKLAFQEHGISMPDDAREVVFPHGIPVTVLDRQLAGAHGTMPRKGLTPESRHEELAAVSTKAEAGLYSEAVVIEEQARRTQLLKGDENLLPVASGTSTSEKQTKEPKP